MIATKVGVEPVDGGGLEGLSAAVIDRECARSLERLGIDEIDLYWAHGEDRSTDLEETVAAFGGLVEGGSVRRLGVSNHPTWRVERARAIAERLGVEPFTALQLTTSYVEPRPGRRRTGQGPPLRLRHRRDGGLARRATRTRSCGSTARWCRAATTARTGRSPTAYDHPGTTARLAALTQVAEAHGVPPSQVVLAWMTARGWKPIVGVSTLEQLDSALAAADLELSARRRGRPLLRAEQP